MSNVVHLEGAKDKEASTPKIHLEFLTSLFHWTSVDLNRPPTLHDFMEGLLVYFFELSKGIRLV